MNAKNVATASTASCGVPFQQVAVMMKQIFSNDKALSSTLI